MQYLALLVPVVSIIMVFIFVSIAAWSENRRKERETYYRHETYRKLMEQPGESSQAVVDLMREEEIREARKRVEGLKLGGLITTVVGLGVMIFLWFLVPQYPIFTAGVIPLLIGLILGFYGFFIAPKAIPREPAGKGTDAQV